MNFKCIQQPHVIQPGAMPSVSSSTKYHSIWERYGIRYYVVEMAVVTLDIEYCWIAVDEKIISNPKEIMRGKLKMDRGYLLSNQIQSRSSQEYLYHFQDQFISSVVMMEFAVLMSKLASSYYGKEVKYEQKM